MIQILVESKTYICVCLFSRVCISLGHGYSHGQGHGQHIDGRGELGTRRKLETTRNYSEKVFENKYLQKVSLKR